MSTLISREIYNQLLSNITQLLSNRGQTVTFNNVDENKKIKTEDIDSNLIDSQSLLRYSSVPASIPDKGNLIVTEFFNRLKQFELDLTNLIGCNNCVEICVQNCTTTCWSGCSGSNVNTVTCGGGNADICGRNCYNGDTWFICLNNCAKYNCINSCNGCSSCINSCSGCCYSGCSSTCYDTCKDSCISDCSNSARYGVLK